MSPLVPANGPVPPVRGPLRNRSRHAALFCYHSINVDGPPFISVSPQTFERQLATLRHWRHQGGGVEALAALGEGRRPRRPQVFLTFDDGYLDNFTQAFPLLQEYEFTAIIFLLPPYVDGAAAFNWPEVAEMQRSYPDVMRSLDWPMVELMAEAGIEFGAHTLTHPHLPQLGDEQLQQELLDCRQRIKQRLGSCPSIAYPFGDWDDRVARAAASAGYEFAFTVPRGAQREATTLALPRVPIDHRDEGGRFLLKLTAPGRRVLLSPAKAVLRRLRPRLTPATGGAR